jgi:hypothetical protein
MLLLLTQKVFLQEIYVFLQFRWTGLSGANRSYVHLETPKLQEVFLEKLTQFSQGNNVLNPPSSNKNGCLWHDICVSSTHLNRPIEKKMILSPPWKLWFGNSVLTRTQCSTCFSSNTVGFLWRDIYASSTQLSKPICYKMSLSPPWKLWFSGSVPLKN